MKKTTILWIIFGLIFLVIFNVFFFTLGGTEHNTSVWVSYGFIHFAYLMAAITPVLTPKSKSMVVLGVSILTISLIYFVIELVVGVIFILVASESPTAAVLTQILVAGLYGIVLIPNMIANERTAEAEKKHKTEIAYVKNASIKLKMIMDGIADKEVRKGLERVYDAVYSSPVKSHPDLAQIENRILLSIDELDEVVLSGNMERALSIINTLSRNVNERNIQVKVMNNE